MCIIKSDKNAHICDNIVEKMTKIRNNTKTSTHFMSLLVQCLEYRVDLQYKVYF